MAGGPVAGIRRYVSEGTVLRIEQGGGATEFTLDPVTNLPLSSAGISLADPSRPVPSETRFAEWKAVAGISFPTQRTKT